MYSRECCWLATLEWLGFEGDTIISSAFKYVLFCQTSYPTKMPHIACAFKCALLMQTSWIGQLVTLIAFFFYFFFCLLLSLYISVSVKCERNGWNVQNANSMPLHGTFLVISRFNLVSPLVLDPPMLLFGKKKKIFFVQNTLVYVVGTAVWVRTNTI